MISTERKMLVASVPGAVLGVFLSLHPLFQALLILQVIDFLTGFLVAYGNRVVSSDASRKGMVKNVVALLLVLAVKVLSGAYNLGFDMAAMVAGWFCITEVISIVENAKRAGWAIPRFLTKALLAMKDQADPDPASDKKKKGE